MVGKPSLWEVRGTRFEAAPAIWKEKEQVGGLSKVSWKEKVQLGLMPSCIPAGSPLSQPPALSEHCPVGCSEVLSWAGFTEIPPCSSLKPGPFTRAVGPGGLRLGQVLGCWELGSGATGAAAMWGECRARVLGSASCSGVVSASPSVPYKSLFFIMLPLHFLFQKSHPLVFSLIFAFNETAL